MYMHHDDHALAISQILHIYLLMLIISGLDLKPLFM